MLLLLLQVVSQMQSVPAEELGDAAQECPKLSSMLLLLLQVLSQLQSVPAEEVRGFDQQCYKLLSMLLLLLQVLSQMHGVPAEEDDDLGQQQGEGQAGPRTHDHRRPGSAGNLVDQGANQTAVATHRSGRPPLAETTANNKLGLKVRRPLQLSSITDAC